MNIHLEGPQFHALLIREVADADRAEVGQAGFRTDGCVFRDLNGNLVILKLVWPGFDLGKPGIDAALGVLVSIGACRVTMRYTRGSAVRYAPVIHSSFPIFSKSKYIMTQGHIISGKTSQ